jgi:thioesterase domain-containing protein
VYRVHRHARHAVGLAPPARPLDLIGERGDEAWRYTAVLGAYRLRRVAAPVVVVWPTRERRRFRVPSDREWQRVQPDAARAQVPGTHMGCSAQEHAAETAAQLRASIDAMLSRAVGEPRRAARPF